MNSIYRVAVLALCVGASGSLAAQAQGTSNTAFGSGALYSNTTGSENTAFGHEVLYSNTTGGRNTATGWYALHANTTGGQNAAVGDAALLSNSTGNQNAAFGHSALASNVAGHDNTASGPYALHHTTGSYNTGIGVLGGYYITSGSWNIDIGAYGSPGDNGAIRIGQPGVQTSFFVAGVSGTAIGGPVPLYVNSSGQLGTVNSSIRYKEDVHDMADASSALFRLRPVTYRYKEPYADGSKPIDYGLIAEEVAQVYPDLVTRDGDGRIQTVQYQKLTPMLLNELQKQEARIRLLEERLLALERGAWQR